MFQRFDVALIALLVFAGVYVSTPTLAQSQFQDFSIYLNTTHDLLSTRRKVFTSELASEVEWNSPHEWRPVQGKGGRPRRGILLVHGLGDSPYSFIDVAKTLQGSGFLVRTVLLAGHGTQPEDLLNVKFGDWREVVSQQAAVLKSDVDQVYLGGFSTGANLVIEYALSDPSIAGLILFSPAFKSNTSLAWMAPLLTKIRPWLLDAEDDSRARNEVRYLMVPTNGLAQFYHSSVRARRALARKAYDKPVLIVAVEHDSVLDAGYMVKAFRERFRHPNSRLIWYGSTRPRGAGDDRVLFKPDRLPEERISQFSHMGVLFDPKNPLYGRDGSLRICWNGQSEEERRGCEDGARVWYSDWGHREAGKIHARLTYNPYYDWQSQIMRNVFD